MNLPGLSRKLASLRGVSWFTIGAISLVSSIGTQAAPVEPLPIRGRPVAAFTGLDTTIQAFMENDGRNIEAGVVGISRGGRIIYLRAFGWWQRPQNVDDPGVPLGENALMRQASLAKPITGAAIQHFDQAGGLGTDPTTQRLNRRTFNLAGNSGLLPVNLPPGATLGSPAMAQITVSHLLSHTGGWDSQNLGSVDPVFDRVREAGIAQNEPDALPTRPQFMGYFLQFPLDFTPGAASYNRNLSGGGVLAVGPGPATTYSNFGYLVLGEILEAHAPGGYLAYVRDHILSPANRIPATECVLTRSRLAVVHIREPEYISRFNNTSVFDYTAPLDQLPSQYGGFHLETMMAHGGLSISSQALLRFANRYLVRYARVGGNDGLGLPLPATGLPDGIDTFHTGALPGCSSILRQLGNGPGAADDLVIHIAFNRRHEPESDTRDDWAIQASDEILAWLQGWQSAVPAPVWPTAECDGFWVTMPEGEPAQQGQRGGYDRPFEGFANALAQTTEGSTLRLKPGSTAWTGTLSERLILDAPEGPVTIGSN